MKRNSSLSGHIPILDVFMTFIAQYALEIYAILFMIAWVTLPKSDKRYRHSLVVAGFAGILAFAAASWKRSTMWVRWAFTTLAILVAVSRVYVCVHWPTDIIGSFIVGVISARILWKLSPKLAPITAFGLRLFGYGKSEGLRDVG